MKRRMLSFICLFALIVSCTITPQQQVVLVTATPWIVIATSAPTDTPTPTTTPTATSLPIATATVVPPTVAPKDVPQYPQITKAIFQDSFTSGNFQSSYEGQRWASDPKQLGVSVKIKPINQVLTDTSTYIDSSGKPQGNVMVVTVSGNPVLKPTWSSNPKELWYAGYPAWEQPVTGKVNGIDVCQNLQGTYGVEADVWVTPNVTGISLLSVHRQSVETGISDSVVAFGVFTNDRVELMVRNNGKDTKIPCISGLWKSGQFNKLTFIINGDDGTVLPFINGQFAVENPDMIPKVRVDGGYKGAFNDAHGGLQRSITDQKDALPQGTMVIDGNFRVFRVK